MPKDRTQQTLGLDDLKPVKARQKWYWTLTKYPSQCASCGALTQPGGVVAFNHELKSAKCEVCGKQHAPIVSRRLQEGRPKIVCPDPPSPQEVEAKSTANMGFTRRQLAEWGVPFPPPKGWRKELELQYEEKRSRPIAPQREAPKVSVPTRETDRNRTKTGKPKKATRRRGRKVKEKTLREEMAAMKARNAANPKFAK